VFNSIDHIHTANHVAEVAPDLFDLYTWSYREDSLLMLPAAFGLAGLAVSMLSQAGVRQGDMLGPLFFTISTTHIIKALIQLPGGRAWAYLNNILIAIMCGIVEAAARAAIVAAFATAEREGALVGLQINRAKLIVWGDGAENLVPQATAGNKLSGQGCTVVEEGLKVLGTPIGSEAFVNRILKGVVARATDTLNLVMDTDLPLQHKFVLLHQCVAQIPTFWA
jgi:hypothetical protein